MSMKPDDHRRKWDRKEYERKALDRKVASVKPEEEGKQFFLNGMFYDILVKLLDAQKKWKNYQF